MDTFIVFAIGFVGVMCWLLAYVQYYIKHHFVPDDGEEEI
jgi:hypothetical protein